ncbi:MAG: LamG-like jellyroll fold domain-containing protein [Isosphaeraceae bacterium]
MTRAVLAADPVVRGHPLNAGRLAWWLDLPRWSRGRRWIDLMGRHDATGVNGPEWGPGGMRFVPGSSQYLQAPAPSLGTLAEFTLAVRYTPATTDWFPLLQRFSGFDGYADGLRIAFGVQPNNVWYADGRACFAIAADASGLAPGSEYFDVLTVGAAPGTGYAEPTIYHNGKALAPSTYVSTGPLNDTAGLPFWIGVDRGPSYANGRVSEASAWDRALSASEVAQLYAEYRAGYPNLLRRRRRPYPTVDAAPPARPWLAGRSPALGTGVY